MNKTLAINIAGSIFHIEEDAYNVIKNYDNEIRNRFNNSPDGFEIVSDIENRIAELFAEKLKTEHRKVIVKQDVVEVINRLGKVSDFDSDEETAEPNEQTRENANEPAESNAKNRKLFRAPRNGILGGVCSGIACYFNVDPTFVRLAWVLLTIAYGAGAIAYVVLWVAVPEQKTSEDRETMNTSRDKDKPRRRLFRDPDDKSIGGVCSGLGIYLDVNPIWIRLLFVALWLFPAVLFGERYIFKPALFFFGFPILLLYILLMIIIPEAKTVADKMAMKGEPDNLDGIIRNVENKAREAGAKAKEAVRNTNIKGVLDTLLAFLGKVLRLTIQFVVKTCGLTLALAAILFIMALPIAVTIYLTDNATAYSDEVWFGTFNFIDDKYLILFVVSLSVVLIVPAFRLAWFGLRTITTNVKLIGKTASLSLWGVWITALVCTSYIAVETALDFREEAAMEESSPVQLATNGMLYLSCTSGNTVYNREIVLDGRSVEKKFYLRHDSRLNRVRLSIEKSPDKNARLIKKTSACGKNAEDAARNIENITYVIEERDSLLSFEETFRLKNKALWRKQEVMAILQLPVGGIVNVNEAACRMSYQLNYRNCRDDENSAYTVWQMTENGLKCLSQKQVDDDSKSSKSSVSGQNDTDKFISER